MDYDELVQRLIELENKFKEHVHTGRDSKRITLGLTNQGNITLKNESVVDGTYGAEEQAVIDNNRNRIEDIENALKANNILS